MELCRGLSAQTRSQQHQLLRRIQVGGVAAGRGRTLCIHWTAAETHVFVDGISTLASAFITTHSLDIFFGVFFVYGSAFST